MRAVIYARYSSDLQSEASIEDQIRLCRERVEQENGSVVDIYADYAISGSSLRNRPNMQALLNAAKDGRFDYVIAEALDRLEMNTQIAIHPNLPELYRRKVAALRQALGDEATRPHAVELIRSLLDRVEVHPSKERGRCEVIIIGALAQLLAFAQQKTTAASPGDGGTFLMVAGARSHLYRTRFNYRRGRP